MVILFIIVVFSAITSIVISSLQRTPILRATVFGERLPNYFSYIIFPIYSTSITTIVLTPDLSVRAYLSKWLERFKETYLILFIAGIVLGTIQTLCNLFLDMPIPQIVSVVSTAAMWSFAALYKKNTKRGKKDGEQEKN